MTDAEMIHEHLTTFVSSTGNYASHVRHYLVDGCPPLVTKCTMNPHEWNLTVLAMTASGQSNVVLSEAFEPRNNNGEEDADRLVAIAARLLRAAADASRPS